MKVNKKIIRILLVFITLFTITLNVKAIDPNDYINGNNNEQEEIQQDNNEEEPQQDNTEPEEEGNKIIIEDDASILLYTEETALQSRMEILKEKGHVAFKSISWNDKTTKEYAEEYYENKFNNESGVLILYDFSNNSIYLLARGEIGTELTDEVAQEILDSAIESVNDKKYYASILEIISKVEEKVGLKTTVSEEKYGNTLLIEDDAKLLTDEEIEKLKKRMDPLRKYGHIVFKSISNNPSYSTQAFANDYYYSKFGNESGTIFIIDMDKRMIYIVSAGENYKVVTKRKAEIITDNIYRYASRQEYYECADKAFEQIGIILDGGKIAEPMRHASNAVISIVLAFFINFFIVLGASKIKKASSEEILKNCDIAFEAGNVSGSKTGSHSVYSPVSESSGGGSSGGGGGGGGGGFSGGGGGHSF